jgi:CheY-like chemotaxis protein
VHGFAAQSGGSVRITSSVGNGTNVDLWLPQAKVYSIKRGDPQPEAFIVEPSQLRILVCDDDTDVRSVIGAFLRDVGYVVWDAEDPFLAFDILEREWPIDLLIADYAMPEMNGLAVIDRAQARYPGLRALLISGHADILHAGGVSSIPLLVKPFKVAELKRRISETLHAPSRDACVIKSASPLLVISS